MTRIEQPRRQQVLQYVRRLRTQQSQILEPRAMPLAVELRDPAEQPLQCDDVPARVGLRVLQRERAVAAAQLQLQRLLHGKQLGQADRFDGGGDRVQQRLSRRQYLVATHRLAKCFV